MESSIYTSSHFFYFKENKEHYTMWSARTPRTKGIKNDNGDEEEAMRKRELNNLSDVFHSIIEIHLQQIDLYTITSHL